MPVSLKIMYENYIFKWKALKNNHFTKYVLEKPNTKKVIKNIESFKSNKSHFLIKKLN